MRHFILFLIFLFSASAQNFSGHWDRAVTYSSKTVKIQNIAPIEILRDGKSYKARYLLSYLGGKDRLIKKVELSKNKINFVLDKSRELHFEGRLVNAKLEGYFYLGKRKEKVSLHRFNNMSSDQLFELAKDNKANFSFPTQNQFRRLLGERGIKAATVVFSRARAKDYKMQLVPKAAMQKLADELIKEKKTNLAADLYKLITMAYPTDVAAFNKFAEVLYINGNKKAAGQVLRHANGLKASKTVKKRTKFLLKKYGFTKN